VERKAIRPIYVASLSSWNSEFSVFGVAGMAIRLMSVNRPNHLFLRIPLKVEIRGQAEETQELLAVLLVGGRPVYGRGNPGPKFAVRPGVPNPQVQALNKEDVATTAVVEGMISISDYEARVLIDPGSTNSFIATPFAYTLELDD
jgi:hypothetical protein